ncbi:nucleotidyltransferase domain-containing protein [Metabacillus idriensis]|uniref:type VII toxin-antitoxin system MntA family adenylyltransferase antitoxin n=1 Tax=Metabacillus idriensis TaxID=324768 RepID=UPI0008AA1CE2|nr:nucleotidyltransferase domain-containing protein [Metabacillus idriensis]MCM3597966.1 nucleotidyltransferase domain-containing protein [Metabacillus idriensis]OHR73560.1 DNA polymerase subunit beta [Bacillus sp. HMSC76G11]
MDNNKQIQIVNLLREKVSPDLIYIFGSTVKGTSHKNSDLDIAFLPRSELDEYEIFILAQKLAEQLNIEVDLVNLKKASTVFQGQIITTGSIIYCSDEQLRMNYEMHALKKYAKLGEERKVIIDKVKESGTVFNEE